MRRTLLVLSTGLMVAGLNPAVAESSDQAVARANLGAYRIALNCFAAYGINVGRYEKAGDRENADATEKQARASFDAALKLGRVLGYKDGQVNTDFSMTQAREVPKLQDRTYFAQTLSICKQVGL